MSTDYNPPKVNELRLDVARRRAGTQGLGYDKILADVVLLLGELGKVKSASAPGEQAEIDLQLVEHMMRKYGASA